MNAIWLVIIGLVAYVLGTVLYSRFISKGIYKLSTTFVTPSNKMKDGVDYVPTNPYILWGHHFTSVAGAAPIIGPAIAVIWGWAPAMLWIVFGTIFFAGIHDMGSIWISVRNSAESIGTIAEKFMGRSVSLLFTLIVFLVLLMVNSVFAVAISNSFVANPTSIVPSWGAIVVAAIIGQLIYRFKWKLPLVTIAGVIVLYLLIFAGTSLPFSLPEGFLGLSPGALWIIILFIYAAIASSLPVWSLLQPRDYINGIQLFIGLIILYLAFIIGAPKVAAPIFNSSLPAGSPPMIPLLFVTIACGAISGFHGLVGSGTTSKQIDKESHIRLVGYGGSLGEGMLSLAALLAVSAGFASLGEWRETYSAFGKGGLNGFIQAGATVISNGLKLDRRFSVNLLAVMGILFAGTTMDTGVRLQRYIIQEWGKRFNLPFLKKNINATLVAVGTCVLLAFGAGGSSGKGGMAIWPLFGASNQLLA
ncbi:MAG: carbon starvation protein A, partial [spirochete symbiont of Stewartia floridana]